MRIGYLIPGCGITGGVAVACQHTNRLLERGHDVHLISETQETKINWFPEQKVPILTVEDFPQDIEILVATGWSTSFKVIDLPAKHKIYFVQSDETRFHDPNSNWQHITALTYLLDFNYMTEARWIQKWLVENFGRQAALIPNGLDETIFFPDKPLSPKSDKPRILLEGAIALPYKGMADAFAAVKDLDAEIWCVSSLGKPKPEWHCDRFFSQVPMGKMRRIYSSCDILLKLSRVEGFFGPPLEMMACGGTAVVGKVTGYDEYIVDGYNALVVEPGDVSAATAAVKKIIGDPQLKEQLIKNGKETAESWNWDKSIDKLEFFFQEILVGKKTYPYSDVRELSDKGIALTFKMAVNRPVNYNEWEPSAFTEPVDRLLHRLRGNKLTVTFANWIYKLYKAFKNI